MGRPRKYHTADEKREAQAENSRRYYAKYVAVGLFECAGHKLLSRKHVIIRRKKRDEYHQQAESSEEGSIDKDDQSQYSDEDDIQDIDEANSSAGLDNSEEIDETLPLDTGYVDLQCSDKSYILYLLQCIVLHRPEHTGFTVRNLQLSAYARALNTINSLASIGDRQLRRACFLNRCRIR